MVFGPVALLGTAEVGYTLHARTGGVVTHSRLSEGSETYTWLRDGKTIPGADEVSYRLTEKDLGKGISMRYSFIADGDLTYVTSDPKICRNEQYKTLEVLYTYLLEREPDTDGLLFWIGYLNQLEKKKDPLALAKVIEEFMTSPGYKKEIK